jgi:hypothetical protein
VYDTSSYCVCGLKRGPLCVCIITYTCAPNGQDWAAVSHGHERLFRRPSSLSIFLKVFSRRFIQQLERPRTKRAHESSAVQTSTLQAYECSALQAYERRLQLSLHIRP